MKTLTIKVLYGALLHTTQGILPLNVIRESDHTATGILEDGTLVIVPKILLSEITQ